MERLTVDAIIEHCEKQLDRYPSNNILYREHEATRYYLQILRHYMKLGTVEYITALQTKNANLRNELCQKCGQYRTTHEGGCDGCKWKKEGV